MKNSIKKQQEAIKMLELLTQKREQDGYVWIKRGTTTKQIHPDKIKQHLEDGWKIVKKCN